MAEDNGSAFIRITNREIYDALVDVRKEVIRVERNVDKLEARIDDVLGENVDLRKRIRALELRVYAVISGLITALPVLARMGGVI